MFSELIDVLRGADGDAGRRRQELAVVGLLVEMARIDGDVDADERAAIVRLAEGRCALAAATAETLDEPAFTRALRDAFSADQRRRVIETLWEIVYADGRMTPAEESLIQRLAARMGVDEASLDEMRAEAFARVDARSA